MKLYLVSDNARGITGQALKIARQQATGNALASSGQHLRRAYFSLNHYEGKE